MTEFQGSFTVMVTPFTEDGAAVDEKALRRLVEWQIEQGAPGLIPLGSTGEFLSVSADERTQIVETIVDQAAGRVPVIIGTADEWTAKAVRYSTEAERLGADGVMVVPPYYSSPTEDELFEHYRQIAEAISIPIMVYNNPNTANVDLLPPFLARLSTLDNVRYVKESSGDIARVGEIAHLSEGRMTVFAGYHAHDSIRLGAKGWVSVCGNIVPRLSADVYDLMAGKDDPAEGRDVYRRLLPLLDAISGDLYVSATKAAMALVGMPVGSPRLPRLPLPESMTAGLKQALSSLGVLRDEAA
ncbi:MAG: 4-hydroxy-tetrahydrodipicolinate synthase [Rhodospirillales bacterium]|nr:4-hydroxy-tetrahydrodipicolinate synthase [Rhodospirillales bacterium]